jgi:hypothetical protein
VGPAAADADVITPLDTVAVPFHAPPLYPFFRYCEMNDAGLEPGG